MNVFSRLFDIALAFLCMFALPFMLYKAELYDIAFDNAVRNADLFIARVQHSECLEDRLVEELLSGSDSITGIRFEIELERESPIAGTEEHVAAKVSFREVSMLLQKYEKIPLGAKDTVKVVIYGQSFGVETKTLRQGRVR